MARRSSNLSPSTSGGPYEERRLRHLSTILVRGLDLALSTEGGGGGAAAAGPSSLGLSFPSSAASTTSPRRPGLGQRSTSISSTRRGRRASTSTSASNQDEPPPPLPTSSQIKSSSASTSSSMARSSSLRRSSTLTTHADGNDDDDGEAAAEGQAPDQTSQGGVDSSPSSSRITLESPSSSSRPMRRRTQSSASAASARSARSTATLRRLDHEEASSSNAAEASLESSYVPRRAHSVADERRSLLHSGWTKESLRRAVKSRLGDCFVALSFPDDVTPFYLTPVSRDATHHSWGAKEGTSQPRVEPTVDFATWSMEDEEGGTEEERARLRSLDLRVVVVELWARSSEGADSAAGAKGAKMEWVKLWGRKVDLSKLRKVSLDDDRATALPPNSVVLGLANLPPLALQDEDDSPEDGKGKEGGASTSRSKRGKGSRHASSVPKTSYYLVTPPPFVNSRPKQLSRRRSSVRKRHGRAASSRRPRPREGGASSDVETSRLDEEEGEASDDAVSEPDMSRPGAREDAEGGSDDEDEEAQVLASSPQRQQQQVRPRLQRALETREVLELSLRETKMMPSYDVEGVRSLLKAQRELETVRFELQSVARDIDDELASREREHALRLRRSSVEEEVRRLSAERDTETEALKSTRKALKERSEALSRRRARLETARRAQATLRSRLSRMEEGCQKLESRCQRLWVKVHRRRIKLLHDLDFIYPIELLDAPSLLFTVVDVPLPNGVASDVSALRNASKQAKGGQAVVIDEATISTAYGFVGQLLMLLSSYLGIPIPYPIAIAGSRGVILDPISVMSGPRTFPLYYVQGSVEPYRFEYGGFLLNKDLQHLMGIEGVSMVDVRHTLPNLKNLIVSLTSERAGATRGGKARGDRQLKGSGDIISLPSSMPSSAAMNGEADHSTTGVAEGDEASKPSSTLLAASQQGSTAAAAAAAASSWTMSSLLGWKSAASTPTPTPARANGSTTNKEGGVDGPAETASGQGSGVEAAQAKGGATEREVPTVRTLGGNKASASAKRGWLG